MKWAFTGVQALTLTGPSVTGQGALTFTLARTGQYTLHATLDDGTTLEKSITVIVDDAPPGPRRWTRHQIPIQRRCRWGPGRRRSC